LPTVTPSTTLKEFVLDYPLVLAKVEVFISTAKLMKTLSIEDR